MGALNEYIKMFESKIKRVLGHDIVVVDDDNDKVILGDPSKVDIHAKHIHSDTLSINSLLDNTIVHGDLTIDGNLFVNGNLNVSGAIASGQVSANRLSCNYAHIHDLAVDRILQEENT
jgi:hypothetical protein